MHRLLDITDVAKRRDDISTSGADAKIWLEFRNKLYLFKYEESKVLSEYIGGRFFKYFGVPVQNVHLAIFNGVVGCLCEDISNGLELRTLKAIHDSSLNTNRMLHPYTLRDVIYLLDNYCKSSTEFVTQLKYQFIKTFVLDAILANRDRHRGNWGYLVNGDDRIVAPVFDNGSCLFPEFDSKETVMLESQVLHKLVIESPKSQVQFNSKRKNTFYKMFDCSNIRQFCNWIDRDKVSSAINFSLELVPEKFHHFYASVIMARYLCIVEGIAFEEAYKLYTSGGLYR